MRRSPDNPAEAPPRLFDLQVNGFAGVDFQQFDLPLPAVEWALRSLRTHDTGRILLTLITDRVDRLCAKLEHYEDLRRRSTLFSEIVIGYHLEGPYLSPLPGFHGAHPPELMKAPDLREFGRLQNAAQGSIRLITLAPEWPGADEFISRLVTQDVRVSIGHSDADEVAIDLAIRAGMTLCTHLGNGVPTRLDRHDNIIQRLLARDELTAVFIPDGIHVPWRTLRNFIRAKPANKVLFTTDCMAAAGAASGRFTLGAIELEVGPDRVVRELGKENFAGSALTMDLACRNAAAFLNWPEGEVRAACSSRVAGALGLHDADELVASTRP